MDGLRWGGSKRSCAQGRRRAAGASLAFVLLCVGPAGADDTGTYLGAATCASSICHGSLVARDGINILQNEYRIWEEQDRHATAYRTLESDRSARIAANLGLDSATDADVCLDCHALNAPSGSRGARFQIEDGVSCEACHGAASGWIESHDDAGQTHAQNVDAGLYPTDDAAARAELCLSCHMGAADKSVNHRIMAAGHPRLSFELDTFSYLQPAHFRTDTDYARRKGVPSSATVWAVGQAAALGRYVSLLADPDQGVHGRWPEFALFDCFSCHHPLGTAPTADGGRSAALLGLPRFERSNALMYQEIVSAALRDEAEYLSIDLGALGDAFAASQEPGELARSMVGRTRAAAGALVSWSPDPGQIEAIMGSLVSESAEPDYVTYADAEQLVMGAQALIATSAELGGTDPAVLRRWNDGLDALFDALADPDRFERVEFIRALALLRE